MSSFLPNFHPLVRQWFQKKFSSATEIQERSWPLIAGQKNLLISAPTGSGKTLTAFLWFINSLLTDLTRSEKERQCQVLYISPLKALNNDIEKNLAGPLQEIQALFEQQKEPMVKIEVATRSGDTPAADRQKMLRRPPDILITTPESLNILLTSQSGRRILTSIKTVILDEVHALYHSKRGAHLATALERLTLLSGEMQRIAISATVKADSKVAEFIGGYYNRNNTLVARPVETAFAPGEKKIELKVHSSFSAGNSAAFESDSWWQVMARHVYEVTQQNQATLVFANSRRHAEKLSRLLNDIEDRVAYAHHGSLSKEVRLLVEQKLKNKELRAIVSTSSLELGIDIGNLDEVILFSPAPSISAAIQRIGRSGHQVGQASRGRIFGLHNHDFLHAATQVRLVNQRNIEVKKPVENCLDLLAQVIISMTAAESWNIDDLYSVLRQSYTFHNLPLEQFHLVLDMLAGRYSASKVYELKARVYLDRSQNTIKARKGVERLVYHSGGTIADRGYFDLVIEKSLHKIGELDEEFVFERSLGDTFSLGNKTWKIRQIDSKRVLVNITDEPATTVPFWRAEGLNRDYHFSSELLKDLQAFDQALNEKRLSQLLLSEYQFDQNSAQTLQDFLTAQKSSTGCALPGPGHVVIEYCADSLLSNDYRQVIIHTLWGGALNRPLGLALQAALEKSSGKIYTIVTNDDCLLLLADREFSANELFSLVTPENLLSLLQVKLESSGIFGAHFRENAGRALLIPKRGFNTRTPLWVSRLRAKKLFERVSGFADFPVTAETWRTVLNDEFDLPNLLLVLQRIANDEIRFTTISTETASPFASGILYERTGEFMYEDDSARQSQDSSSLKQSLVNQVAHTSTLRPDIDRDLVENFTLKKQRRAPGYTPQDSDELQLLVSECVFLTDRQYQALLQAIEHDLGAPPDPSSLVKLEPAGIVTTADTVLLLQQSNILKPGTQISWLNQLPFEQGGHNTPTDDSLAGTLFLNWLANFGIISLDYALECWGFSSLDVSSLVDQLVEDRLVIKDYFFKDSQAGQAEICLVENLESLLRLQRHRSRRQQVPTLPLAWLQPFLCQLHGMGNQAGDPFELLQQALERLFGYTLPPQLWEDEVFFNRVAGYQPYLLDQALSQYNLVWQGTASKKIQFYLDEESGNLATTPTEEIQLPFPSETGLFSSEELLDYSNLDLDNFNETLWHDAWAGHLSTKDFTPLRQPQPPGAAAKPLAARQVHQKVRRWQKQGSGSWYRLQFAEKKADALEQLEGQKELARLLLRRYGVVSRQLLKHEEGRLRWSKIFRALSLLELSGEIYSGYFFEGLDGLQFASSEAIALLGQLKDIDQVYLFNATDPVSTCGKQLTLELPDRKRGNQLVYHNNHLVLSTGRNFKDLFVYCPADSPHLPRYLQVLTTVLHKPVNPPRQIFFETINGEPALGSDYASVLQAAGFSRRYKGLALSR